MFGAYDGDLPRTLDGLFALEQRIGVTLPLVQIYTAWGDAPEQQFPLAVASAIMGYGLVPVVTWEPWLTEFESGRHPHLPLRERATGTEWPRSLAGDYDFYIDAWAASTAEIRHAASICGSATR